MSKETKNTESKNVVANNSNESVVLTEKSVDVVENTESDNVVNATVVATRFYSKTIEKKQLVNGVLVVVPDKSYKVDLLELTLDKSLKVFVKDLNTGLFVESTSNKVDISLNELKKLLSFASDKFAFVVPMPIRTIITDERYQHCSDEDLTQLFFGSVMLHSQVVVQSTLVPAGTVVGGTTASDRDRYFNEVVGIIPTAEATAYVATKSLF